MCVLDILFALACSSSTTKNNLQSSVVSEDSAHERDSALDSPRDTEDTNESPVDTEDSESPPVIDVRSVDSVTDAIIFGERTSGLLYDRIGDVDGDGYTEIISFESDFYVENTLGNILILPVLLSGVQSGSYLQKSNIIGNEDHPLNSPASLYVGDLDDDSIDEIIINESNIDCFLQLYIIKPPATGQASLLDVALWEFQTETVFASGPRAGTSVGIALADFSGDGNTDMAIGGDAGDAVYPCLSGCRLFSIKNY